MKILRDWALSALWRIKVRRSFQELEDAPAISLFPNDEAIWDRISSRMEGFHPQPPPRYSRNHKLKPMLLGFALAGVLALVFPLMRDEASFTNKASGPEELTLPPSTLTFAVVKKDGTMSRGSHLAKLHPGETLIFQIETPGLSSDGKFTLQLIAHGPQGTQETIVDAFPVESKTESLKGAQGFIVFKPDLIGTYRFEGKRTLGEFSDKASGFTIEMMDR